MVGRLAIQAGRFPQFWLMKSSIRSAVVFGSTVTGFSVGGGGAGTDAHLSTIVSDAAGVTDGPVSAATTASSIAATAVIVRPFVIVFSSLILSVVLKRNSPKLFRARCGIFVPD